jgi:hypothetical protein
VLVVTIAIGVLAVIPRTAGFFYREKGDILYSSIFQQLLTLGLQVFGH